MNIKLTIGIILMIIGIAGIIVSQTVSFTYETTTRYDDNIFGTFYMPDWETNDGLKYGILFGGIGFLLIGGILLAISLGRNKFLKKENIADIEEKNKLALKEIAKKSVFEDKLKNEPLNVEILHEYSRFLFKNLLFKETISILLKILVINEKDGMAKELLFKSYLKLNMLDEALDAGLQILEEKPDDILIIEDLAEISLKQEKYENALKYLESILNISPNNTDVLKKKSEALLQINKLEEAIIILKKLYEIDKTDIIATLYVGIDKALNSNFEQALKILLPISSNIENERDKSRSFLYIAYSMSQLNMNIEETEEWLAKINLPVLEEVNHSLDKDTFVESFLSIVKNKLSNIKPTDNIKFTLDTLIIYYLNPLQEFITEKTKSKIAEVLFEISMIQCDLKLYSDSLISCKEAFNYFPLNDKYKEKCEEIKKLLKLKVHKKKRKIIKTFVIAATVIVIAAVGWYLSHGKILVHISPIGDKIYLDEKACDKYVKNYLSPELFFGSHKIKIEKDGYENWEQEVKVGFGKTKNINAELVPIYGGLNVNTVPTGAEVYLDGKPMGKTPLKANEILATNHILEIKEEGYKSHYTSVTIPGKGILNLGSVVLKNLTGKWKGKKWGAEFVLEIKQSGTNLEISYLLKEKNGNGWGKGKVSGKVFGQRFHIIKGTLVYYTDGRRYGGAYMTSVLKGSISGDWDRIRGDDNWWVERKSENL